MKYETDEEIRSRLAAERNRRRLAVAEDTRRANTALAISLSLILLLVPGIIAFVSLGPSKSSTPPPAQTPVAQVTSTVAAPSPTATVATPSPTATIATPSPTSTTTTQPAEAPLTVPFVAGISDVQTIGTYTGAVTITVSGTGQADGKRFSDAFYIYTDQNGTIVLPMHNAQLYSLCINGKPVDNFVQAIPSYSSNHTYTFSINAPGGRLSFGVCATNFTNNRGSFTIKFP